jgi:hypothetical protein
MVFSTVWRVVEGVGNVDMHLGEAGSLLIAPSCCDFLVERAGI